MKPTAVRSIFWNGLKYGLGVGLLVYVIGANWTGSGGRGISESLKGPLQIGPLVLAGGLAILSLVLTSVRWYLLVQAQQLPLSLWNAVRFGALGYFLGNVLPGNVGGDLGRAVAIARNQERRAVAIATILADGLVALWTLLLLVMVVGSVSSLVGGMTEHGTERYFVGAALVGVIVGAVGFLAMRLVRADHAEWATAWLGRFPALRNIVLDLCNAGRMYCRQTGTVAIAAVVSLGAQIAAVVAFFLAARVFDQDCALPTLAQHFVLVPIGMLIQFGFPAPGGMGGGEYGYGFLYELAVPGANAAGVLAALVARGINFGVGIAGYILYLVTASSSTESQGAGEEPRLAA